MQAHEKYYRFIIRQQVVNQEFCDVNTYRVTLNLECNRYGATNIKRHRHCEDLPTIAHSYVLKELRKTFDRVFMETFSSIYK